MDEREWNRADADARIRIFTPTMELPFAGHPTLGTAIVLAAESGRSVVRLETAMGVVPVRLTTGAGPAPFGRMLQPLPRAAPFPAPEALLSALGVARSTLPVDHYDNGPSYAYVALESAAEVASLRPDFARLAALGTTAFSVFAPAGDRFRARVFAPGEGIDEDPATGAAAGPLALHLARHGRIRFGDEIVIEQGVEIGRPSTLYARVVGDAARLEEVEVSGHSVVVGRGEFAF